MSLLLGHGHADARLYPVGMVADEAGLVIQRVNAAAGAQALLAHLSAAAVPNMNVKPSATGKAQKRFRETIDVLMESADG